MSPCGDIRPLRGVVAAQRPLRSQKKQTITYMEQWMALAARCGDTAGKMGGEKVRPSETMRSTRRGDLDGVLDDSPLFWSFR